MIKEITQFVANKLTLTIGTDIYTGHRPLDSNDNCHCVMIRTPGESFHELPKFYNISVQILTRNAVYMDCHNAAWAIYEVLQGYNRENLPVVESGPAYEIFTITAIGVPAYIGQDDTLRFEYSANYIFRMNKI